MTEGWAKLRQIWREWHEDNPPDKVMRIDHSSHLPKGCFIEAGTMRLILPGRRKTNIYVECRRP